MSSARYLQQTTWYIDPQNVSAAANDNNSGALQTAPLRTFREFTRRVGTKIHVPAGVTFQIYYLSDGPQDDPFDLEVSRDDATAAFELLGILNAADATTVDSYTPADPATNLLPDVQMAAPVFAAGDENTFVVYNFTQDSWSPVAVSLTDPNRLLMESFIGSDGTVGTVAQGDGIRKIQPKSIWISRLQQVASANAAGLIDSQRMVRMIGMQPVRATNLDNVMLIGCLLDEVLSLQNCFIGGCKTARANITSATAANNWIGCYIDGSNGKTTIFGEGDQIAANALSLLRGDQIFSKSSAALSVFNAMSDGCVLSVGRGGACVFGQNNAFFGQEIQVTLRDASLMRRTLLNWDNSGSGNPVIIWANTSAAVYEAPSLVPPGPAVPPPSTDWAGYNSGSGSWIGQLTGARLTTSLPITSTVPR